MRGAWALGLALVVAAAGCSSTDSSPPPAQTRVEYPKVDPLKDRDERAVLAALRPIDPCALLDPAALGAPAGTKPDPIAPHRCVMRTAPAGNQVAAVVGIEFDRPARYRAQLVDLGNIRAYVTAGPGADFCQVVIPVSFELAISFEGTLDGGDACALAKSVATVAAKRLASPPAGSTTGWTACELLAGQGTQYVFESPNGAQGIDQCTMSERTEDNKPGKTVFELMLRYSGDPTEGVKDVRTVSGQRIAVMPDGAGCYYEWRQDSVVVELLATDCKRGEPVVPTLIASLGQPNPDKTAPQRPITIRPDEPDQAMVGACVDFPYETGCQPSSEVPVPKGAQAAFSALAADARVACTLAGDSVRAQFGADMAPILGSPSTVPLGCYLVERTHTVMVELFANTHDTLAASMPTGGPEITVAGRPAMTSTSGNDRRLCVLPVRDTKTGTLCVVAHFLPGRGKETGAPVDTSKADRLEPAVADLLGRYFS
jgi:hypothetical protein